MSRATILEAEKERKKELTFEDFKKKCEERGKYFNIDKNISLLSCYDEELLIYFYYKNEPKGHKTVVPQIRLSHKEHERLYRELKKHINEMISLRLRDIHDGDKKNNKMKVDDVIDFINVFGYSVRAAKPSHIDTILKKSMIMSGLRANKASNLVDSAKIMDVGSILFFIELYSNLELVLNEDNNTINLEEFISGMKNDLGIPELKDKLLDNVPEKKFTEIKENIEFIEKEPILLIEPWKNQEEAIGAWLRTEDGIVEMPTGTGKTIVGLLAIEEVLKEEPDASILIVCHSRAILNQWREEIIRKFGLTRANPERNFENSIYVEAEKGENAKISFETIQSLQRKLSPEAISILNMGSKNPSFEQNLNKYNRIIIDSIKKELEYIYYADLLIIDEVHHSISGPAFRKILEVTKDKRRLGLTATIKGKDIPKRIFEDSGIRVVYTYTFNQALEDGLIPRFDWKIVPVELTIPEEKEYNKISKYIINIFNYIINNEKILNDCGFKKKEKPDLYAILKKIRDMEFRGKITDIPDSCKILKNKILQRRWILHKSKPKLDEVEKIISNIMQNYKEKKNIIVYMMDVESVENLYNRLAEKLDEPMDKHVYRVHSKRKSEENTKDIREFRHKSETVKHSDKPYILIGAKMLDEGIDIPQAEIGINVASSKTQLQMIQRLGRILRKGKGNKEPMFYHLSSIFSEEHMRDIGEIDDLGLFDEISWVVDTALTLGITPQIEGIPEGPDLEEIINRISDNLISEEKLEKEELKFPVKIGTIHVKSIIQQLEEELRDEILVRLNEMDADEISYSEWIDLLLSSKETILNKEINKEEVVRVNWPGNWYIYQLGKRNPKMIIEIIKSFT